MSLWVISSLWDEVQGRVGHDWVTELELESNVVYGGVHNFEQLGKQEEHPYNRRDGGGDAKREGRMNSKVYFTSKTFA